MSETPQRRYGKYFLSTEADEEEYPDSQVKFNTKIVTAKPRVRRKDFFDDSDFEIPEDNTDGTGEPQLDDSGNPIETSPEADTNINGDDTVNTDQTQTDIQQNADENQEMNGEDTPSEEPTPDQNIDTPQPEVQIDGTDVPIDNGTEETDDGPSFNNDDLENQINGVNTEINNAEGNNLPNASVDTGDGMVDAEINTDEPVDDGPVLDDTQTDLTDPNAIADPNMENPADPNTVPSDPNQKKGPGIEYDSTRKYVLFNKYLDLIAAMDGYIEKVESGMADDYNVNIVYKQASNQLRSIRDLVYDFATIKFELMSYVQSLLFYQNAIVMIYKVFDMIEKSKKQIEKNKSK